ncbi:MAG: hypothetical protein B6244_00745 [Candidatus Cloacimonetes bacterium 4572_55]|nr:MAG: hypothetical protein B6244_00745 [Candidatus Cloacimonetes bacterium 4572_55]
MARIHEYKGKELLKKFKIPVPKGRTARTADEVRAIAEELACPVVIKGQAWTTSRKAQGLIQFADNPKEAEEKADQILGGTVNNFRIETLLVEEQLKIAKEFYAGVIIDDVTQMPLLIFSSRGGSGIEEIAEKYPESVAKSHIDIVEGLQDYQARNVARRTGISGKMLLRLGGLLQKLWRVARAYEARSAEINPIALTEDGALYAADCRITVDDYSVFRHPDLGIDIARELDRPPSRLDRIAYDVEKNDYRGTFYFIQMEQNFEKNAGYLGFHGAGGGGSMMSMDAVFNRGFKIANFCDTSGNPPASKVYRAAKIILAQRNIDGYFGSGSGVASQEQFHSARGLVKAFREENLSIPAVIRLGGNSEDEAVRILTEYTKDLPAPVEGYKKDDSADFCAERIDDLLKNADINLDKRVPKSRQPKAADSCAKYGFNTLTGRVTFDHEICLTCETKVCISSCAPQILKEENRVPVLNITPEEAKKGKCTECLACEVECEQHGKGGGFIDLPIVGLTQYLNESGGAITP